MATVHRPVMAAECLAAMALSPGDVAVDGTAGGGGHTVRIAKAVGEHGHLIAVDRDPTMLERARQTMGEETNQVTFRAGSYRELRTILDESEIDAVNAILVDLGLSSDQLADRDRGFGFQTGGPLDLRFDTSTGVPASEWLASSDEATVRRALLDWGDLRPGTAVTEAVISTRRALKRTEDLADVVLRAAGGRGKTHPATVVLQALRIAVNDELGHVAEALNVVFPSCLKPGGRLAVLTFHSTEDRLVKQCLKRKEVWTCKQKKPILPRPAEVRDNPRSRSAKLRVALRKV